MTCVRSVEYMDLRSNPTNLWAQPLEGGKPKQLTHFPSDLIFNFVWSRDGKLLALSRGTFSSDAVLFSSSH